MNRNKVICDIIFGFITLKPHIITIIDTPEFQRLRGVLQLGLTAFIYPTAHHNRFEHSIGTYWLASKIITKIQKQLIDENAEIQISEKDVICVEIAALCHDIGHGPFSHFWDMKVLPKFCPNDHTLHEEKFKEMWEILKENKKVDDMLKKNHITMDDEILINHLIQGTVVNGKEVLFNIVNNTESGMDVDKWDYLARDSTYLGHSSTNYRNDIDRMIILVRAIKDVDLKWKLAYRDTEALNILRVFQLRHYMHQTAYQHRTSVALEQMMLDGIQRCIDKNILSHLEIGTTKWILQNTDSIFWSNFNDIEEFIRILQRDLYKPICEAVKFEVVVNPEIELKNHLSSKNIPLDNIRFGFCSFKLGNKETNPIFNVPFYSKNNDKVIKRFIQETLPTNLNINCNESRIIILATSMDNIDNINYIKNCLIEHLKTLNWRITNKF